jgi:hypothetical protein
VRPHEVAGQTAVLAKCLDELSIPGEPYKAITILLRRGWTRPMAIGNENVAVGSFNAGGGFNEGVLARFRYARFSKGEQQFAVGAEFENLVAFDPCGRAIVERSAIERPCDDANSRGLPSRPTNRLSTSPAALICTMPGTERCWSHTPPFPSGTMPMAAPGLMSPKCGQLGSIL